MLPIDHWFHTLTPVLVDFARWEGFGDTVRKMSVLGESSYNLEYHELAAPVAFRIGNVFLISPFGGLPLLWMARWATWDVQSLQDSDHAIMDLAETGHSLLFTREGDNVIVENPSHGIRAETDYDTLLAAWEDCSKRIREYLVAELPELAERSDFAPWFRGEKDWWID